MEHLALEIFDIGGTGSKYANLPEAATITLTDTSEVFASGDAWSLSFQLNTYANAHIFGSAGDMHGARLHEQIHKRHARLWAEGLPLFFGYLTLGDEAEVDGEGNVDVGFESGQKTFDEMINGAKANQVPLMSDIEIGMALWRKRWTKLKVKLQASVQIHTEIFDSIAWGDVTHDGDDPEWFSFACDGENEGNSVQEYPHMVFPNGYFKSDVDGSNWSENLINTDNPYSESESGAPEHPYCNIALCYQKYGYEKKDSNGAVTPHYNEEPEAQRGYEYMPANRVNSAPCFFVIYWIRALMKHLGIHVEENQMMGVEDLRRLFFVNTRCDYEEPEKLRTVTPDERYGRYRSTYGSFLIPEYLNAKKSVKMDDSGFVGKDVVSEKPLASDVTIKVVDVKEWDDQDKVDYCSANSYFHKAYATSECFPNVDISEVIKAIEGGFGVRFLFSDDYQRVRIVLLRNIFRGSEVQEIACDITGEDKVENSIRGFRMTYGDSEDTHFYYKGFADKLPHKKELWADNSDKHDYSHWKLDAVYGNIIKQVSSFDKTCYVTPDTGNAYIIKIDKDAKRYDDLHPSLFGCAEFMDAEDGDCTGEEETIETVNVGFTPAIVNDLNMEEERDGSTKQRFALFVDDTMRPRRPDLDTGQDYNDPKAVYNVDGLLYRQIDGEYVFAGKMSDGIVKPGEFAITSDMFGSGGRVNAYMSYRPGALPITTHFNMSFNFDGHINEGYHLYLQDNYEPNDEGISPIEKHDWGLTLGIMRGSGSDAHVEYSADPQDGEGNDTWEIAAGSSVSAHPDICDNYGRLFDYTADGQEDEQDAKGRFSLKLRAEKLNPYFDPKQPEGENNRRYLKIDNENLQQRGLIDQFYKEYSYWVRNARIAKETVKMELAQLLAIDKTKKVKVGDVTGYVRKMQYTISNQTGLGEVTMEIMYI